MTLEEFSRLCRDLAATTKRLLKIALVADALRRLDPEEVPWAVAFLAGCPLPRSDPRDLGVSWATLARVRERAAPAERGGTLTLLDAAETFGAIAAASGPGSRREKERRLADLLGRASEEEAEVLVHVLMGEMRIGVHEGLIQEAVARAAGVDAGLVRRAALFLGDLSEVARVALGEGVERLEAVSPRLFVPLLPMMAEMAGGLEEVFEEHGGRTALEVKYDGARIQLHKAGDEVRIWSRRLSEVTASLPDIVELARARLLATEAILDGEVVAIGADGRPLPFQELMRRFRRVHDVAQTARDLPLALYLFDCLYAAGRSLIDEPYAARWEVLARVTAGRHLARRIIPGDLGEGQAFLAEALAAGHEGVMAKALSSPYTPGVRGRRWFKVKLAERLDCVIVAADRGSGRRQGWLSNYHLAVRDEANGGFAEVGKTFKGLTDAEFAEMTARLLALKTGDDGVTVRVRPEVVVEVGYNEIQRSPHYPSGYALRFARITRIRDDKSPAQADTLGRLRQLYDRQFEVKSRTGPPR